MGHSGGGLEDKNVERNTRSGGLAQGASMGTLQRSGLEVILVTLYVSVLRMAMR